MKFDKSPLTFEKQLQKIQNKYDIEINNKELALHYLKHCNYYKLRGYWLYFEQKKQKATFEDVINLYEFDKKLRNLLLDYIEKIETSVKTNFAYHLSTKYENPFVYLNSKLFIKKEYHQKAINKLQESFNSSKEIFVTHFKTKYKEKLPPIWAAVELMTLGEVSKWINNLNNKDRKKIAKVYSFKSPYILSSFLHHITDIRNISAHHSRLWNKTFPSKFEIPKEFLHLLEKDHYKISHTITMMEYMLSSIVLNNVFFEMFVKLVKLHNIPLQYMGFSKELWKYLNYKYKDKQ